MKTKIFFGNNGDMIDNEISQFITGKKVIDIKFGVASDANGHTTLGVLIMYEVLSK